MGRPTVGPEASVFTGISAFPLTPLNQDVVDEPAFVRLVERLVAAKVDSITALGSTGAYAYLSSEERARVIRVAIEHAGDTPVFAGVGALRTSQALTHVESAQEAGVHGLLLAPMSYHPLTEDDVFSLYQAVSREASVPVIAYDNQGATSFRFTTELYGRIAELPGIASIKIPAVPSNLDQARARIAQVRAVLPPHVTIGVSGDPTATLGLLAGADAWYSAIAGVLPDPVLRIDRTVQQANTDEAIRQSQALEPLWGLIREHGPLRLCAGIAEHMGLATRSCLPLPIQGMSDPERDRLGRILLHV